EAEEREAGEEQGRVRQVEGREHEDGADDVRQDVAEERARAEEPRSRADWTYSASATESTSPRTTRAYEGQATTTIASAAFCKPRPRTAATTIASTIGGNAKTRSAARMKKPSTTPRK